MSLRLPYRAPFAWDAHLAFLAGRAVPGVERIDADGYTRTLRIDEHVGWFRVRLAEKSAVALDVSAGLAPRLMAVVAKVKDLFDKYGLNSHSAPMPQLVYSAWHKVVRLSLPNGWMATTNVKNLPEQTKLLWAMTTKGPKIRRAAAARLQQQARKQQAA